MKLSDIPVKVEGTPRADGGLGGGVTALLHEILAKLEHFRATGEEDEIDLRSLPMTADDREALADALGRGEIEAVFDDPGGPSHVRETGIHGVWQIEHRDADDEIAASFIEITTIPALLITDRADVERGIATLRARLAAEPASGHTATGAS